MEESERAEVLDGPGAGGAGGGEGVRAGGHGIAHRGRPRIVDGVAVPPVIPDYLGLSEDDLRRRQFRRSRRRASSRRRRAAGIEECPECGRPTDAREGQLDRSCARCRVSQHWRPKVEALSQEVIRSSVRVSVLKSAIERMDEAIRDGEDPSPIFAQAMEWHDDEVEALMELTEAVRGAMETLGRLRRRPEIARVLEAMQALGARW